MKLHDAIKKAEHNGLHEITLRKKPDGWGLCLKLDGQPEGLWKIGGTLEQAMAYILPATAEAETKFLSLFD